jgi:hypothetical protein
LNYSNFSSEIKSKSGHKYGQKNEFLSASPPASFSFPLHHTINGKLQQAVCLKGEEPSQN